MNYWSITSFRALQGKGVSLSSAFAMVNFLNEHTLTKGKGILHKILSLWYHLKQADLEPIYWV